MAPLEEISLDDMRRQFETNVFGSLRLSQLVLPAMRRTGRGRIVNVSGYRLGQLLFVATRPGWATVNPV